MLRVVGHQLASQDPEAHVGLDDEPAGKPTGVCVSTIAPEYTLHDPGCPLTTMAVGDTVMSQFAGIWPSAVVDL